MNALLEWTFFLWMIILAGLIFIGGYFMFRKFLKSMPKADGKSVLDWQDYYIQKSLPLWNEEGKRLLNELVSPVPDLFRETAKRTIAGKIAEIALNEGAEKIDQDLIIRGYIIATPKRDHKWLIKHLTTKNIDFSKYSSLME